MAATFFSLGIEHRPNGDILGIVWDIVAEGETAGCASIRELVEGPVDAVREYLTPYTDEAEHVRIACENVKVANGDDVFSIALENAPY